MEGEKVEMEVVGWAREMVKAAEDVEVAAEGVAVAVGVGVSRLPGIS